MRPGYRTPAGRDEVGIGERGRFFIGIAVGPVPGVSEQFGRGFVAGHDHEEQETDDLVVGQPIAVDLGREQGRGQIVGGLTSALIEHVGVVHDQVECGGHPFGCHVVHAVGSVDEEI